MIDYQYDPLYRLTGATYSGVLTDTFAYSYDAVGNRLTQNNNGVVTNYAYDHANRLTSVNGVTYSWDNNGNLLSDGVNTYGYDQANRLISVNGQTTFAYNGVGDRLRQTVNSTITNYTLDLNTGLTQVLADGTNTYLYGAGRIAQQPTNQPTNIQYFGADGLGSVRQLYDTTGAALANKRYDPFGIVLGAMGAGSVYGYTGEQTDATGLVFLRARYLDPAQGRFTTRDTWEGNVNQPLSFNKWNYTNSNPVNWVDPSGYDRSCPKSAGRWTWDCQAVEGVYQLKDAFLDSARRHNKIPTMDNNAFAALVAAIIVNERKIGNVPEKGKPGDQDSINKENVVAALGCIETGERVAAACGPCLDGKGGCDLCIQHLQNQKIPAGSALPEESAVYVLASVGIGNMKLATGSNLWRGVACGTYGPCVPVRVSPLKLTNHVVMFSWDTELQNPFDALPGQSPTVPEQQLYPYDPKEEPAYKALSSQLLDDRTNIEYVAANLEAAALRALKLDTQPSAFNAATWHMRGLTTDKEIDAYIRRYAWQTGPGGPSLVVETIPIGLSTWDLSSSWNVSTETQYEHWKSQ